MSLFTDLRTVLAPVVANVYPDVAPNNAPLPYLVYSQIGGQSPTFIDNAVPSKVNGVYQLTIFSTTRQASYDLMLAVESALTVAAAFQARPVGAMQSTLDDESDLRGASQDFSIWSDR